MSLKRIELQGFKSFRDKTVINFEHGYTCIVGPNGCGKSNVSDAIRWVLGEQSAKQLRGENMKGVIFSGTATLPEMGYAEVTLVFDNSDGMFQTTYEEIAITRKVFRSKQDNYYYINHKPCRRSDIIELMRGTGAGKESLSIIEQGAVSNVMRVKPEDRRVIFDEAAGISGAKIEKKKNLKQLAETQLNIDTLNVRIEEMDKQLGPLRKQMEAVNKYEIYHDELQLLEFNMFIYKYEHADSEKEKERAKIRDYEEFLRTKEALLEKTRLKIDDVQRQIDDNDRQTRALIDRRETLKVNRAKASGDQQTHQAKLEALEGTLAHLEENYNLSVTARDDTAVELAEAKNVLQIKKDNKFDLDLEYSVVNASLESVIEDIEASERGLDAATNERLADMSKLSQVHSEQAKAEAQESLLKENLDKDDKEIAECKKQIEDKKRLTADLEKSQSTVQQEYENINVNRKSCVSAGNEARYEKGDLDKRIREMDVRVQTAEVNVKTLQNAVRAKKGYSKAVEFLVRHSQNNANVSRHMMGVVSDLYQVDARYAEAIEVALAASVNHVVTPTQDDANALINMVREAGVGRITCMPLNRIKAEQLAYEYRPALGERGVLGVASDLIAYDQKYDVIFQRLLGRILIVDSYDTGKYLDGKYRGGLKIVTLDGKLFDPSGTLSGGSRKTQEEMLLDRERKTLEALVADRQKLLDKRAQLDAIIEKCETYIRESRDKQDELQERFITLKTQIEASNAAIEQLHERIRDIEGEKVHINIRLESLHRNIQEAQTASGELENSSLDRDQLMEKAKADKETKKAMRDSLTERRAALTARINAVAAEIAAIEKDIKRLTDENVKAASAVSGLTVDIANKKAEIEAHVAAKPELVFTAEEGEILDKINKEIVVRDERKVELQKEGEKLAQDVTDLGNYISEAKQDKVRSEGKIEKIDTELQQWRDRIYEDYDGKTYEDVVYAKLEQFEYTKAPAQIAVLRGNITKLGAINFQAKEQFEQLSQEREYQFNQMNDALKAKANIEEVIQRSTLAMNQQFDKAFTQINENFQNTFAELFGGGKAELLLVENPDNPDDDKGVDISVQLPGKSKGPLSRLSGGEQTLTAIAILFAILKLKPMPFVVLDEAESALDDVNCNRFARFLRRYADTAKFIVITHKKPTMERADVLYGVTMQQPGVSNVVSVSLEAAVKHSQDN
ncbi:MAG: chromosome segregation protein SMC [Clostridia bacterium]|nr:chromosome segregation protein SMC [Clostridia bacterium]